MNSRKHSSSGSQSGGKRYVKNKLQIGDAKPNFGVKPEMRSVGSQHASYNKINSSNVGINNIYANQSNKAVKLTDGTKMKKEVRATSPRAAEVYGSKKKAMKKSYERPPKTTSTNKSNTKTNRPRKKGLI